MKKFIFLLALFTFLPIRAWADQELTGDTKLACEAILCLSSGTRPGECGPSLSRYFGISHKKWKDTVKVRRNFLNQCPTVGEDPSMPTLVEAILDGAGRCTADLLNRQLRKQVPVEECIPAKIWNNMNWKDREETPRCRTKWVWIIDDALPSYCRTYAGHEYTWKVGVNYIGEPLNGGHWIGE